jgi:hypothetical protein
MALSARAESALYYLWATLVCPLAGFAAFWATADLLRPTSALLDYLALLASPALLALGGAALTHRRRKAAVLGAIAAALLAAGALFALAVWIASQGSFG